MTLGRTKPRDYNTPKAVPTTEVTSAFNVQPVVDTLLKELEKRGMALSMGNINPHGMLRSIPGSTIFGLPSTAAGQDETDDDALALNPGHKRRRQNDILGPKKSLWLPWGD